MKKTIVYLSVLLLLIFATVSAWSVEIQEPKLNPPVTTLPEYPVIDGSSSTIPLHSAIRAYLTDVYLTATHTDIYSFFPGYEVIGTFGTMEHHFETLNYKRASLPESYSKTYSSLERLIPKSEEPTDVPQKDDKLLILLGQVPNSKEPADVLLSTKYSDESLQNAKERGADLVITPIAKDAFVFMVNKDNPIDSLTQDQIRDIYSGKITKWSEIAGYLTFSLIRGFSFCSDTLGKTAMLDFMGDTQLINPYPPAVAELSGMPGRALIPDHKQSAIGYNLYSIEKADVLSPKDRALLNQQKPRVDPFRFSFQSYGSTYDTSFTKFLAIDGVMPTAETIADGTYPLVIYTYSYYNKGNEKGKALTDWLLTEEGQKVIASSGHVGIFGEMPPSETINFDKDDSGARITLGKFYEEQNMHITSPIKLHDEALIKALAGEKAKDVTTVYLSEQRLDARSNVVNGLRFIVLTRAKGGEYEVINEGDVAELEKNGYGKILEDWLLTNEGEKVIQNFKDTGVFGELSLSEKIDFDKADINAQNTIRKFYQESGFKIRIHFRLEDETLIKALSDGKAKDFTTLYAVRDFKEIVLPVGMDMYWGDAYYFDENNAPAQMTSGSLFGLGSEERRRFLKEHKPHTYNELRFILLTINKGGEFEIINEWAVTEFDKNTYGKALTDWLSTAEGQKIVPNNGIHVGIFGELSISEKIDFDKYVADAKEEIEKFYKSKRMKIGIKERLQDVELFKALSDGKFKDSAVIYLTEYGTGNHALLRFIVLTKAKGGKFEVINEGSTAEYEKNGYGEAFKNWLLTKEGQRIPRNDYSGVFGELLPSEKIDFYTYIIEAGKVIKKFYKDKNLAIGVAIKVCNEAQAKELADGKAKDITILYSVPTSEIDTYNPKGLRFIVLTKTRGSEFEIINEGSAIEYKNNVLVL